MIPQPAGWQIARDGDAILMVPPDAGVGFIRYLERQRPLALLPELVLRRLVAFEIVEISKPNLFVTDEGEYAARVSATVRRGATDVWRELGFAFVDDFVAVLDATVLEREYREAFRELADRLVRADVHMLGERRRPCVYQPPARWRSSTLGDRTVWTPADCDRAIGLTAYHAVPKRAGCSVESLVAAMYRQDAAGGYVLIGCEAELAARNHHGLEGTTIAMAGKFPEHPETHRLIAVLEDSDFVYLFRIDAAEPVAGADRALFAEVVASARPIPRRRAGDSDAFAHWAA